MRYKFHLKISLIVFQPDPSESLIKITKNIFFRRLHNRKPVFQAEAGMKCQINELEAYGSGSYRDRELARPNFAN